MKKVLLHGAFFGSNYGDVLFAEIFLKKIMNNANPILGKVGHYLKNRLNLTYQNIELINFFKSDAVIFAPGGYFGEPNSTWLKLLFWRIRMITKHSYLGLLCIVFKKPFSIIGIGVGPIRFSLGKWIVRTIFNHASYVTVRDIESMQYLLEIGVKNNNISITVDSIVCIGNDLISNESITKAENFLNNEKKTLLLHISSGGEKGIQVAKAIKLFLESNKEYELIICTDFLLNGKNKFIEKIKLVFNEFDYKFLDFSPEMLSAVIHESDIIITSKLHVGIVAATFSKSVLSFPVHSKTLRFFKQINESNRCIPMNQITSEDVYELIEKYKNVRINIPKELIKKSNNNFTVLDDFIRNL